MRIGMQEKNLYSIGQVSRLCKIPVKTLRYYDQIKVLLPTVRKEISKYRYYTKEQLIKAFMIRQLRLRGFKLKVIKDMINKNNLLASINGIEQRLSEVEQEISELQSCWRENNNLLVRLKQGQELLSKCRQHKLRTFFQIEKMPTIFLLCSRSIMKSYHNEEVNLERWIEVSERSVGYGLKTAGPVFITFFTEMFGQFFVKHCDVEFALQVEQPLKKNSNVRPFGGFQAATALHWGAYGEIFKTYIALKRWIDEQDYEVCGCVTEEFYISPLDIRDESEHLTKIIVPVKKVQ